ncbi:S1C family serine protease [Spirillospora sp. CA-294931]|uniref:S1C family serine protease n=1 Tax=Spirillospora sp. CA-294931 TaxID=3240042 RepID=UPI003D8A287A
MTEENRRPGETLPQDDDLVPGFGPERQEGARAEDDDDRTPSEDDRPLPQDDPPGDSLDHPVVLEVPAEGDRQVAGFAPPDYLDDDRGADLVKPPVTATDRPLVESPEQGRPPRPGFAPYGGEAPGMGSPPPAPHGPPPQGSPYGWPAHHSQQPPPAPPGPPMGGGPPPMGPPPMGRPYGPPPPGGGPNWAPVPGAPASYSRGAPSTGMLVVLALVVALVAGGVGAGITALASGSDDEPSSVSLGGDDSSGSGPAAKNRPPDSVAGVAQKVLPSVVSIRVQAASGDGAGGTGFIVNGGYIITNSHVVSAGGGGDIQIVFNDKKTATATIKGKDQNSDIAVLKPEGGHSLPALPMGNSDDLAVGDPVIAIGSPLGLQGSVTTGIVSSVNRAVPTGGEGGGDGSVLNAIQTDAAINPGNSGGPLVDAKGRVIGINTAIYTLGGRSLGGETQSGSIGLGFAIPVNQGRRVAEEIIRGGVARRAQIGIGMDQRFPGPGVRITDKQEGSVAPILKGGPAEKAGLKPGDVIIKINDQPIGNPADLAAQIRSHAPGDKIKVTYQRAGKETVAEVVLGAAN